MNKLFSKVLQYSGANTIARHILKKKLFVLNYHSVSSDENYSELQGDLYRNLSIDIELFEKHIKLLKDNGHTFITIKEAFDENLGKLNKPTIIYFDDGFKDNLLNALPVLKKHNLRATACISTGLVNRSHMLWTIKYRAYIKSQKADMTSVEDEILWYKKSSTLERERVLGEVYEASNFKWLLQDQNIFLSWQDLEQLSQEGWDIASHGASHLSLTELSSEKMVSEISESKKAIEGHLATEVVGFSYPYGRWSPCINEKLREEGYKVVMSIGHGLNSFGMVAGGFVCLKTIPVKITDSVSDLESKLYSRYFLRA